MPCRSIPSATTQHDSAKCTPSIIIATRSSVLRSALSSSARAVSVWATNFRDNADRLVPDALAWTAAPTGSRPIW